MARKVKIDDSELQKKLRRLTRKLDETSSYAVKEVADIAKARAKQLAPKDTGSVYSYIVSGTSKEKDGFVGTVTAKNPPDKSVLIGRKVMRYYGGPNSIVRNKYKGSVVQFLHSPDYPRPRSTHPEGKNFMFKTRDWMKENGYSKIKERFKKVKL